MAAGALKSAAGQAAGEERRSFEVVPGGFKVLVYGMNEVANPAK